MPIRGNRVYNDPNIGAAFENIAGMFAPPSAQDLAGYADAGLKNQRRDIIEKLRADPRYQGADGGVLADLFDPTNSWAAQDQNTATARRGQDITAATSRANNFSDNQRSLISDMFQPMNQGQIRPELPADVSVLFGVPALPQVAGAPKPLSETEVLGANLSAQLPGMSTEEQLALAMGNTPVENIATPEGPRTVYRTQAVGQEPYFNKGAEAKPENGIAVLPDGRRVTTVQADDGTWLNAQTGETLPADIQVFKLPQAQGSATDVGLAPTTANQTNANNRRAEVTRALGLLDLYEGVIKNDPSAIGMAGAIKGLAQNTIAVTQDLAGAFGASMPELQKFQTDLQNGLKGVAPEMFNSNIPEAEFYQGALAYALARTENPSGEVSRQAYERALDRVTGGALRNSQSASAAVSAFRQMLNTELSAIDTLDDPSKARTDTSYQGGPVVTPASTEGVPDGWDPEDWKFLTEEEQQQVLNGG